mgnify:CR=1 FL=1
MFHIVGCAVGTNYSTPKVSVPESWSELQQKVQQEPVEITRARYKAGLSGELDAVQAEALLATTQSQIPLLENSMKHKSAKCTTGAVITEL